MSDQQKVDIDYILNYIIIGDPAVGKSNLLLRYTEGEFNEEYKFTQGLAFGKKIIKIGDKNYSIKIYETNGQEKNRTFIRTYLKEKVCAFVVYDISSKESFNNIPTWIQECKSNGPKTISMVLVGNKKDLENERQVSFDEAKEFADKYELPFYETSTKNGENVNEIFEDSAKEIAKNIEQNCYDLKDETCGISVGKKKKKDGCLCRCF